MTQEISRASGVTLTRDSKLPTVIYIRYSSANLPNIAGNIQGTGDGWKITVYLPTPDGTPDPISELLEGYDSQVQETLDQAIEELESRIANREEWFKVHKTRIAGLGERHRQEADALFGDSQFP